MWPSGANIKMKWEGGTLERNARAWTVHGLGLENGWQCLK